MDELPDWLIQISKNPVLLDVLNSLFANEQFASRVGEARGDGRFPLYVGDWGLFDRLPIAPRPTDGAVGATVHARQGPVSNAGIAIDVDRLHKLVEQDSVQARTLVRDALIHEFAHVLPVMQARSGSAALGDPGPGVDATQTPIMQQENVLRGLLGLSARTQYGLPIK